MSDNQPLADMLSRSTAPLALLLNDAVNWWDTVNRSVVWQDRIFHLLAALYGLVTAVALVQLVRIQLRVPEYGWTTQKVFHFLNFLVNAVRCLVFIFRRDIQDLEPEIFQHVVLDLPSLAFFTTYALLVLFWAEIYYQARAVSTDWLGPTFYTINGVVYAIQIILWVVQWWKPIHATVVLSRMFFAGVSLFAALGFILYGGRLFLMLQRFPVESKGRRKKLQEVGYMTTICFSCFLIRSIMYLIFDLLVFAICASNTAPRLHETGYLPTSIYAYGMCFNALQTAADLDVLDHPVLNFIYYFLVEILPSALILFILRKLPPRRGITQYHPIR